MENFAKYINLKTVKKNIIIYMIWILCLGAKMVGGGVLNISLKMLTGLLSSGR